jgi:hypothetical protein
MHRLAGRVDRRLMREHHHPPGPLHDRQPALQRQGAHDAVRAASLAGPPVAAADEPWQHYDLGHGYRTRTFFGQCPHRTARARCDSYAPKDPGKAQLLEARANPQKTRAVIPLTEDEQAAVDDGSAALGRLPGRPAGTPAPAGPTPRQIAAPGRAALLPAIEINRKPAR